MKTIEIALATDEGYVCGLIITAASLAMNASRDVALRFHILDCGIRDDSYADIIRRVSPWHPSVFFRRHFITDKMLQDLPEWHGGKAAYARLFAPNLLEDVTDLIYCDVDFLWLSDVAELWELKTDDYMMIAVRDTSLETLENERAWFKRMGLAFMPERYFCSGLCFMNLQRIRERKFMDAVLDFYKKYPEVRTQYADQTALNYVFRDDVILVDAKWQQLTGLLDAEACAHPSVLHFAGDTPWKRKFLVNMITDAVLLWHRYYARVYGITIWQSLRKFFPVWQIIYRRALWYMTGSRWSRSIVCWFLRMIGKRECAIYITDARKALDWRHA